MYKCVYINTNENSSVSNLPTKGAIPRNAPTGLTKSIFSRNPATKGATPRSAPTDRPRRGARLHRRGLHPARPPADQAHGVPRPGFVRGDKLLAALLTLPASRHRGAAPPPARAERGRKSGGRVSRQQEALDYLPNRGFD